MSELSNETKLREEEQVFSSEFIYQAVNAVRSFNEQVSYIGDKDNLEEALRKTYKQSFSISDFYLIQRRWANCGSFNKHNLMPWFDFSYYALKGFEEEKARRVVETFHNTTDEWDSLIDYVEKHNSSKSVLEAKSWLHGMKKGTKRSATAGVDRRLLHHHLLQLYSRFPTRNYIHGGLYSNFINTEPKDARSVRAFYVFLDKEKTKNGYPMYLVWELRDKKEGGVIKRDGEYGQEVDQIGSGKRENSAVELFNEYLLPIFNEPTFNGSGKFDFTKSKISHMLWFPLYEEYVGGRFHGFFRGWLFQVLTPERPEQDHATTHPLLEGREDATDLDDKFIDYTSRCLKRSHLLTTDLNRAVLREALNQRIAKRTSYEVLSSNLCLLGDWNVARTQPHNAEQNSKFRSTAKVCDESASVALTINLDPPFLEKHSSEFLEKRARTFITFDDIHEDIKRNQELYLEFGPDFRRPSEKHESYYDRLTNNIYIILTRLKNAKWTEISSQAQGQLEEARSQVGKWAHALQTKLALLEEIYNRSSSEIEGDDAVRTNIKGTLKSLRQTIVALSYYQRVRDYLQQSDTSILELSKQSNNQDFPEPERSLGHLLLEAFYLMAAKIRLRSEKYADVKDRMPEFYDSCANINKLPQLTNEETREDSPVNIDDLRVLLPANGSVKLTTTDESIFREVGTWKKIDFKEKGISFYYDVAIGVVIDEILSNACKYVARPEKDQRPWITININVEMDNSQPWAVFEVINTAPLQEYEGLLDDKRDFINYEEKTKAKGLGLFFNKELCETLVGENWRDSYTVTISEDYRSFNTTFRFPVGRIL